MILACLIMYVLVAWGAVYLALAGWLGFATRRVLAHRRSPFSRLTMIVFIASCALRVLWSAMWHLEVFLATVVLAVALWASVAVMYVRERSLNGRSRWMPFSVYLSWVTVLLLVNIAHYVTRATPQDTGILPAVSTIVLLAALLFASYAMRRLCDDYLFGIVVLWSGIGIGVRLMATSVAFGVAVIAIMALGGAASYIPWERLNISRRAGLDADSDRARRHAR